MVFFQISFLLPGFSGSPFLQNPVVPSIPSFSTGRAFRLYVDRYQDEPRPTVTAVASETKKNRARFPYFAETDLVAPPRFDDVVVGIAVAVYTPVGRLVVIKIVVAGFPSPPPAPLDAEGDAFKSVEGGLCIAPTGGVPGTPACIATLRGGGVQSDSSA